MKPAPAPRGSLGHVEGLDGLRGVAALLVVGFHAGLVRGGSLGVDVFFVLSGFLITAVLEEEQRATGRVALGRFYARRALRLLPALYAIVCVALACSLVLTPSYVFGAIGWRAPIAAVLYASNWAAVASGRNLGILQPTWSLALEEQFYLAWPLAYLWLARARTSPRTAALVALGLAVTSAGWRAWLWRGLPATFQESTQFYREYVSSDTRAYALLVGCALALGRDAVAARVTPRALGAASAAAGVVLGIAVFAYDYERETGWAFVAAPCAAVLVGGALGTRSWVSRALGTGPLRWVGQRSYGIYLWHLAAFAVVSPESASDPYVTPPSTLQLLAMLAATFGLGAISYALVERPFLRLKGRLSWSAAATPRQLQASEPVRLVFAPGEDA